MQRERLSQYLSLGGRPVVEKRRREVHAESPTNQLIINPTELDGAENGESSSYKEKQEKENAISLPPSPATYPFLFW